MTHFLSGMKKDCGWDHWLAKSRNLKTKRKKYFYWCIFNSKSSTYVSSITTSYIDENTTVLNSITNKLPLVKQRLMYTSCTRSFVLNKSIKVTTQLQFLSFLPSWNPELRAAQVWSHTLKKVFIHLCHNQSKVFSKSLTVNLLDCSFDLPTTEYISRSPKQFIPCKCKDLPIIYCQQVCSSFQPFILW